MGRRGPGPAETRTCSIAASPRGGWPGPPSAEATQLSSIRAPKPLPRRCAPLLTLSRRLAASRPAKSRRSNGGTTGEEHNERNGMPFLVGWQSRLRRQRWRRRSPSPVAVLTHHPRYFTTSAQTTGGKCRPGVRRRVRKRRRTKRIWGTDGEWRRARNGVRWAAGPKPMGGAGGSRVRRAPLVSRGRGGIIVGRGAWVLPTK